MKRVSRTDSSLDRLLQRKGRSIVQDEQVNDQCFYPLLAITRVAIHRGISINYRPFDATQ